MIYLIAHLDKFVKIGYTKNIHKRLSQLQTSSPVKLEVLHLIDGDVSLEKELHKMFKNYRANGEWFNYNSEIIEYFQDKKCLLWEFGFTSQEKIPITGLIKYERLSKNMSLVTLAEMYGCTAQSIKEMETREMNGSITIGILHKVARLFNKKFEYRFVDK